MRNVLAQFVLLCTHGVIVMLISVFVFNTGELFVWRNLARFLTPVPPTAEASYQYTPTGGAIVTGTNPAIQGATAANAEGTNLGSWRGAVADDNWHQGITSTASGFNVYYDMAGVQLNNANTIIIQTEFDLDATAPNTLVQICDWVSSTGVNNAADAQCTGGGWRNLNLNDAVINTATPTAYGWHIYNGYWNSSATTPIDTPLTNFLNSGSMRIRFFSTTNTTSVVHIDYIRAHAVVNPIYMASGATQISGGAPTGDYSQTKIGVTQTGSNDARFGVPGTAGSISDFYLSFDDVRTYEGANTILVRAEYSCSAAGINHRPKIFNFTTASWEDLTTASIACSATDATNAWAKNNVTISDYVNNGEIRVGWRGLANGTQEIRIDFIYIMIGTTNTDGTSEITSGSTNAGTVANTRDLDMTGTSNTWNILSADESNTQAFPVYARDNDGDATVEEATAVNLNFNVTLPPNTAATAVYSASRHMFGTGGTIQPAIKDYSGYTSVLGGWSFVGAGGGTTLTYSDNITTNSVSPTGSAGFNTNPEDHIDTVNNRINLALRTTASGATANNAIAQWDFAMVSVQWVDVPKVNTLSFSISDNTIGFGPVGTAAARYATGDTLGSAADTNNAHTISAATNASSGYTITINGTTLTCSTCGGVTIAAIGGTAAASSPGSEQFGLRGEVVSGTGVLSAPYDSVNWALDGAAFPDVLATGIGDNVTTVFGMRYIANVAATTESGQYSSNLTYVVTASY